MPRTYILRKLLLKLRDLGSLAYPSASKRLDQCSFLFRSEGRLRDGNALRCNCRTHCASAPTRDAAFVTFLHSINSRSPCSNETVGLNPSILSALSIEALRRVTFATLRASRCSGRNDEPVTFSTRSHSSFKVV